MGTTKSLGSKEEFDKFYTTETNVDFCLSKLDLAYYDYIIEPSAGNGSFSKKIKNCIALDIMPEDESIVKQDFLKYTPNFNGNILVVGNPPFGNNSSLAIKFFNHSAEFCNTIAFIIPKSFRKVSVQNKLNKFFWLREDFDINNTFLLKGEEYSVPCCFQIWEKRNEERKIFKYTPIEEIDFVDRSNADFRVQRVGGNSGKAFNNLIGSDQSNYFIKNKSSVSTENLIKIINSIEFNDINNTSGPRSLSKLEFIEKLKNYL